MNCQHCQNLLLDHLYGLLEGAEAAAVDAHLASCPVCAAVRAETGRVQGLIARAAKTAFPNTRFEPPAPAPTQPTKGTTRTPAATTVLPSPAPVATAQPAQKTGFSRRIAALTPWAVAAAVLLAIPGTVVPVLGIFQRADSAARTAERATHEAESAEVAVRTATEEGKKALSDAEFKYTAAKQAELALLDQWNNSLQAALLADTDRKLIVDVHKPAAIQPGAPNDFLVVVRDGREGWETRGQLVAEVHAVDASDAVIFTQPLNHQSKGDTHALRLPASAWAKVSPQAELFLVVAQVSDRGRTELQEKIKLAGPVFTTLLATDRSTYRPGDRLFFRSLTLDRITLKPPTREQILKYELLNPARRPVPGLNVTGSTDLVHVSDGGRVDPVRGADGQPVRGVGCGEFVLPADLPDGDYTLALREQQHPGGFPPTVPVEVTRAIKVRSGARDNYRKQIGFKGRTAYAAGETVEAWAELKFQDKPLPDAAVTAVAVEIDRTPVDGVEVSKETDKDGRAYLRFALPGEVLDGDVRLKVTFRTPHGEEAVAERVPVIGNRLAVEFFPEGGDAGVAGVPCKVYVRATTPAGQAVDIRGTVTDGRRTIARVESLRDQQQPGANRGLASFTYTPEPGVPMFLKLEAPAGAYAPILSGVPVSKTAVAVLGGAGACAARTGFMLPQPKHDGVVMSVLNPVTGPGEPFRVRLHSVGQPRALVVGAYTRGKLSDTQKVTVEPDLPQTIELMGGADPRGGVVRITCFEEPDDRPGEPKPDLKPVAERLVFRKPGEVLNLAIATARAAPATGAQAAAPGPGFGFAPGSAIDLSIAATDEKGNPAAAILWAAAINSGAGRGAKDRLMPTHFLLAGEVKNPDDLEYADFLLTDQPKAAEALDLVLGTQGWRRFAEQVPPSAAPAALGTPHPPRAVKPELAQLMIRNGQYTTQVDPAPLRDQHALNQKYAPRYEAAVRAAAKARAALDAARADRRDADAVARAARAAEDAKRAAAEEAARAESAREPVRWFHANVWFGVAGLAALALTCGFVAVTRPGGRFPLGFSTLGSLGLAAFLVVAAGWGDRATAAPTAARDPAGRELAMNEPATAPKDDGAADPAFKPGPAPPTMPGRSAPLGAEAKTPANEPVTGKVPNGGPETGAKGGANSSGSFAGPPLKPVAPPLKPVAPPLPMHSPQMHPHIAAPKLVFPGGGMGGAPGPVPPPPAGLAPSGPSGTAPRPLPAALPAPGGIGLEGWNPHRRGGVTKADLDQSRESAFGLLSENVNRAGRAAEQTKKLKEVCDTATRFAHDRAAANATGLNLYFADRTRLRDGPAAGLAPLGFDKRQVDRIAAERLRGTVTVAVAPLVVREFAAPRPAPVPPADDADSPDTVLWQPVLVLPADGKTALTFHLGAAPGGYDLVVAGHTADGRLGAVRGFIPVAPMKTFAPTAPVTPGAPPAPVAPVAPASQPMP